MCRELSGSVHPGSLTALIGPNGSGKTTLLRAFAGAASDRCRPYRSRRREAGGRLTVPQASQLDRIVSDLLPGCGGLADRRPGRFRSIRAGGHPRQAEAALRRVGLAEEGDRPIRALSAGQFQRVLFARTMLQDAPVLLLDEPFTAVDTATTIVRWDGIASLARAGSHDCDRSARPGPRAPRLPAHAAADRRQWPGPAGSERANCKRAPLSIGRGMDIGTMLDVRWFRLLSRFMRRALAGCLALSIAAPPLGVFLVLRRMSLMSDVMQHGVLPGIAVGAAVAGMSRMGDGPGGSRPG